MAQPQTNEKHEESRRDVEAGFDPREILRLLLAYKWLILGITLVASVATTFVTLRLPKVYEAACSVEYDPSPPRPLGSEIEDVASPATSIAMSREFFETQNRILASRVVAEMVVRRLALHRDASFFGDVQPGNAGRARARGIPEAAQTLQERLTVEPVKGTRLVTIKVQDRDPERAATLANAIVDAYIEKTMQDRMGSTVSALEWLNTQLDNLRRQLDESELALHQFKQENNVLSVSMEDRQNIVASDIQAFNEALTTTRTKRIELAARLEQLQRANREDPMDVYAAMVAENDTITALREQFRTKMTEHEGLSTRYGVSHPRLAVLDSELVALRGQVRREIDGLIRTAEANLREVQQVERGLRGALEESNQAGLELNLREIEYRRLNRARENNSKLHELLLSRSTETDLTRMLRVTNARVVDRALKPVAPIRPNVQLNIGGGILFGLLLGIALAVGFARFDTRVKSVETAEALGLTILGIVPQLGKPENRPRRPARLKPPVATERDLIVHTQPRSSAAECCRTIRTNLAFMSADEPLRAMLVTSPSPGEGKTMVAVSLAIAIAQSGKRVLLIDTDLRRPRLHRVFGASGAAGVTSVLVGERTLDKVVVPTPVANLDLLPCGSVPPNPAELLHSSRFREMLNTALASYDRVIFDSPPLGAVIDAAILAPQLDGALLVIRAHQTDRHAVTSALRQLRDVSARTLGGILNGVDLSNARYGQGSYYYYRREGYYSSDEDAPSTPSTSAGNA